MPLADIVQVTISLASASVAAAGFGVPLIAGLTNHFADRYRAYTGLAGMLADGYTTSDPEYIAAQQLLSQANVPPLFLIGRRLPAVAQVDHITINSVTVGNVYTATVNGTACSYTAIGGDTPTAVATGLAAAIHAQLAITGVEGTSALAVVSLTAQTPGNAFTDVLGGTGSGQMTLVSNFVANHGLQEDLADFRAAGATWYGTTIVSRSNPDILNGAAWTEANTTPPTIFMPQSSEATSASAAPNAISGTDLANRLFGLRYRRTGLWWHGLDAEYLDASIVGRELPIDPGLDNWALKGLVGVSVDALSQTSKNNLIGADVGLGKNANVYYALQTSGANPITSRGTMASGDWIDVIRFIDFLTARISEAVANLFLGSERVTLDETGLQQIAAAVSGVLQAAKDAHKVTSFLVQVPAITSISNADRVARRLNPPITFSAQLSGAFNFAKMQGTVTQ